MRSEGAGRGLLAPPRHRAPSKVMGVAALAASVVSLVGLSLATVGSTASHEPAVPFDPGVLTGVGPHGRHAALPRMPGDLLHPPRCSITLRLGHGELLLPGGQVSLRSVNFAARRFFELPHVLPVWYRPFQHNHTPPVFPAINPSRIPQPPPAKSTGHEALLTGRNSTKELE